MTFLDTAFDTLFPRTPCPYCNQLFHLGECAVVSRVNAGTIIDPIPQGTWRRRWSRIQTKQLVGPRYTHEWASRQCPHCQKLLPFDFEVVDENLTIAVVGDTFSGKSHYIAALIDQLKKGVESTFSGSCQLSATSPEVEDRYRNDYYNPLFKQKERLPLTAQTFDPKTDPLIFKLTLGGTPRRQVNLLIYDASGEDLANIENLVRYKRHILNARAMIFIADPWSMQGFTQRLAHHLRPDAPQVSGRVSAEVMNNVVGVFQRNMGNDGLSKFPLPVAIALSKSDLIEFLIGNNQQYGFLYTTATSSLDTKEHTYVDNCVRSLLLDIDEKRLLDAADNFEKASFFAISATGSSADQNGKYADVRPRRCLEPLFWILRELRLIS